MFKIEVEKLPKRKVVLMRDMKPLQIGIVVTDGMYKERVVMRTADVEKFEVIDLTDPGVNCCWTGNPTMTVELLPSGTRITFVVTEDGEEES